MVASFNTCAKLVNLERMKTFGKYTLGLLAIVVVGLAFSTSSCKKEDPTVVLITVIDTSGAPVSNALVNVKGEGTDTSITVPEDELRFNDNKKTNGKGKVSFDYSDMTMPGQAGFAVLDVTAVKGELYGKTVVEVKENQISEATVRVRPE